MAGTLRIAVVTDIHHGRISFTKLGPDALRLLTGALAEMDADEVDLVVDLGDRISDVDRDVDRELTAAVAEAFASSSTPHHHILGNHDVAHLAVEDSEELFGRSMRSTSFDLGGLHLVMWQADVRPDRSVGFAASEDDLDWLAADLAATDLPCVVFSHIPLDGASLRGNFWFQNNERFGGLANVDDVQRVLQSSGNVIACIAGHVHRNQLSTIDGVHHITVQSLSDSYSSGGVACGAWATIEIDDERIAWTTHGLDPISMTLTRRTVGRHWDPPLPPFEEIRRARVEA